MNGVAVPSGCDPEPRSVTIHPGHTPIKVPSAHIGPIPVRASDAPVDLYSPRHSLTPRRGADPNADGVSTPQVGDAHVPPSTHHSGARIITHTLIPAPSTPHPDLPPALIHPGHIAPQITPGRNPP